jgi:apolipoprotein N-acyltransferase
MHKYAILIRMESQIQIAPVVAVAPSRPLPRVRLLLLAALTTAGLLWLCYFPVDCGWLAWFALVPFLALVRSTARPRWVYLCAWVGGLAFYFPALQWMRVADPRMYITWMFVAVTCSLYFPIALRIIRFLDRRTALPLVLTLPVVWTALEYFRGWFLTGFSWYLLGHTQHDFLPIIQFADLTGAYGVTFLVAAVNAVLFEALYRWEWFRVRFAGIDAPPPRPLKTTLIQTGAVAAMVIAAISYGEWRLAQDDFPIGPRIALVQGSVPQQIRNDQVNMSNVEAAHFIALCDLAAAQKPDLIVWPETSFPEEWYETAGDAPARLPEDWNLNIKKCRSQCREAARQWGTKILLGLNSSVFEADGHTHRYNSALLIDRDGNALGRYDKIHCIPFGEYVPLRDEFPWMQKFAPYDDYEYSVSPGRAETRFTLGQGTDRPYTFGVVICYEDTDAVRAIPYAGGDGGAPVDFLLNISNDGWFSGTSEHDEHLAICRFRAIECRRSIARAVNMGISALIDGNGRVVAPRPVAGTEWNDDRVRKLLQSRFGGLTAPERELAVSLFPDDDKAAMWLASPSRGAAGLPTTRWADYKKVPGVLLADVPIDNRFSLYALWGDWLPWSCWTLIGAGLVLAWVRPKEPRPE